MKRKGKEKILGIGKLVLQFCFDDCAVVIVIPWCPNPVLTIYDDWTDDRLTGIESEQKEGSIVRWKGGKDG